MRVITTMKNRNTLIIRRYGFEYTPAGQSTAAVTAQTDFVIDSEPMDGVSTRLFAPRPNVFADDQTLPIDRALSRGEVSASG